MYSFQARINANMAVEMIPGTEIGRQILKNVPNWLQPSTRALSSISLGMAASKYPLIIKVQKGTAHTVYAMISPLYVFVIPILNIMK